MLAIFEIKTCCGDHIGYVELEVELSIFNDYPEWDEFDISQEYGEKAVSAYGVENYECGSCYSRAYRGKFHAWKGNNDG